MRGAAYGRLLRLPLSTPTGTYYSAAAVAAVSPPGLFWRLGDTLLGSLTRTKRIPKFHIHCYSKEDDVVFLSHSFSENCPYVSVCEMRLTTLLTTQGS